VDLLLLLVVSLIRIGAFHPKFRLIWHAVFFLIHHRDPWLASFPSIKHDERNIATTVLLAIWLGYVLWHRHLHASMLKKVMLMPTKVVAIVG